MIDPSKNLISNDIFTDPLPEQRVYSLTNSTVNFLKSIGVWNLMDHSRIKPIEKMQVWEIQGKGYLKFSKSTSEPLGYIAENRHILWALHKRLEQLGTCDLRIPNKISEVELNENSFARVKLTDSELFTARLVVGAEGANSFIKKSAKIPSWGWSTDQYGIVCTLRTGPNNTAWQRFTNDGPIAILPLWGEYSSLVWSCGHEQYQYLSNLNDEEFLDELNYVLTKQSKTNTFSLSLTNDTFDFPPIIQELCNKRLSFPLKMLQAQTYTAHRVALIGDAAHTVHPLAGQGLNLGITDVVYLANDIVRNLKAGHDIGSVNSLQNYEFKSKSINYPMMFGLEFIKRSYEYNSSNPFIQMRNFGINTINNFIPGKNFLIDFADGKYLHPKKYEWVYDL